MSARRDLDSVIVCRSCRGIGYEVWRVQNTQPDGQPLASWRHEVRARGDQLPPLGPGWNPACPACGAAMDRRAA